MTALDPSDENVGEIYQILYDIFYIDKSEYIEDAVIYAHGAAAVISHLIDITNDQNISCKEIFVSRRWTANSQYRSNLIGVNFRDGVSIVASRDWIDVPYVEKQRANIDESLVRFLYEDFNSADSLNLETVHRLVQRFMDYHLCSDIVSVANFCHMNDFGVNLLENYLPKSWHIEKSSELQPGSFRLSIIEFCGGDLQVINLSAKDIRVEVVDLCGCIHAIFCKAVDQFDHPYRGGSNPREPIEKRLFLAFYYLPVHSNGLRSSDFAVMDDVLAAGDGDQVVAKTLSKWKKWVINPEALYKHASKHIRQNDDSTSSLVSTGSLMKINRNSAANLRESLVASHKIK